MPMLRSPNDGTAEGPPRTETLGAKRADSDRVFLALLICLYSLWWVFLAIAPSNRFDWALENLLVFIVWGLLYAGYRVYPLSRGAYVSIAVFLALHALGAHYTYAETPVGDLIGRLFATERNHYDRIVHFSFGLLWVVPFKVFLERYVAVGKESWSAFLAVCLVLALSGLYELLEWAAALLLEPDAAMAFLGAQGDPFDGQKDAGLAFLGSLFGMAAFYCRPAVRRR